MATSRLARGRLFFGSLALAAGAACGVDIEELDPDGGEAPQGAVSPDAAVAGDAGDEADGGLAPDSGDAPDASFTADAGLNVDAGPARDGGKPDAGPKVDAGPAEPVFFKPPMPTSFARTLTCGAAWNQALSSDVQVGMIGTNVTSVVGVDTKFGGVGAKFELLNQSSPGNYVNVIESRSGAGAGWQTSMLVKDAPGGVGTIVFNQAAGNSTPTQWGYANTYGTNGSNLYALGWNPVSSDHIHATSVVHSPCIPNGYVFDDGAVDILGSKVATPHGNALVWKNEYRYRSRVAQSWPSVSVEQALYLSRTVARNGNLRLYLRRGTVQHGPFKPFDAFSIPGAICNQTNGSHCNTLRYDYALFVWNIFGRDIGVAIPDLNQVSMNLETRTYCADAANDSCGNINFHSWVKNGGADTTTVGEVRAYSQRYYVGTLSQLADLGFTTW